jgi:hypothetical protein
MKLVRLAVEYNPEPSIPDSLLYVIEVCQEQVTDLSEQVHEWNVRAVLLTTAGTQSAIETNTYLNTN